MWLLILAIVILFLSSLQTAYYAECRTMKSIERPLVFTMIEPFLICSNFIFLIAGFTMLFVAVGWWGFAGIVGWWLLFTMERVTWRKRYES